LTCPHKIREKIQTIDLYFIKCCPHPIKLSIKKIFIKLLGTKRAMGELHWKKDCANESMTKIAEGVMQLVNIKVFNLKNKQRK
jgi:hypothetical protein